jgi:uncharacterized glyoxalase superfamily protein PhnB
MPHFYFKKEMKPIRRVSYSVATFPGHSEIKGGHNMSDQQPAAPYAPIIPAFFVDSVETMRSFYMDQLGFGHMMGVVGKDGKLDFCIVVHDDAMVMISRPQDRIEGTGVTYPTRRPLDMYVYLKDVDAYHAEVKGRGVEIMEPLTTQWWGDRNFAVKDPYGYVIWFSQTIGAFEPPPGVKVI